MLKRPLSRLALALVLTATIAAGAAFASHYRFERVDVVTKAERAAFARAGISDTRSLLEWTATLSKRVWLARETGIPYERLAALATQCDLLRIEGVGPSMVEVLQKAGVQDTRALARALPEPLLERFQEVTAGTRMRRLLPQVDTIAAWIRLARRLPTVIDVPEPPAPEPLAP